MLVRNHISENYTTLDDPAGDPSSLNAPIPTLWKRPSLNKTTRHKCCHCWLRLWLDLRLVIIDLHGNLNIAIQSDEKASSLQIPFQRHPVQTMKKSMFMEPDKQFEFEWLSKRTTTFGRNNIAVTMYCGTLRSLCWNFRA